MYHAIFVGSKPGDLDRAIVEGSPTDSGYHVLLNIEEDMGVS